MRRGVRQVIVFDLDDTLYLERDYVASGFVATGDWLEQTRGLRDFGETAWRLFEAGVRGNTFDAALAELGQPADAKLVAELVYTYRSHAPRIALQRDAAAFLARPPAGHALALLSDGFLQSQSNKVRALELEQRGIWPVILTDRWGRQFWKPHLRGFEVIALSHEVPAAACTYVADNPAKDFVAPRQLGWRTVQIARPQRLHTAPCPSAAHAPDHVIAALDELMPVLGSEPGG